MAVKLQIRNDTASAWTSANPILAEGELAIESDTRKFKIGNGITAWNSLVYATQGEVGPPGATGKGISSIVRTSGTGAASTTDTYTITYSDSTTSTFTVVNGSTGATGIPGSPGAVGNGISSIARTGGTGAAGTTDTYTITFTNSTTATFTVYNGVDGATTTSMGALIVSATAKTAPADTDYIPIMDSAASNVMKKLSWAYVKSVLNTHFLSNVQTLTNKTLTSPKLNGTVALAATSTELNYVVGVTSTIQTQLNAKAPLASPALTGTPTIAGNIAYHAGNITISTVAPGSALAEGYQHQVY